MTQLTLTRISTSENGTFGVVTMGNRIIFVTCEDPWKDNAVGESCIPAGKYAVAPYSSKKFPRSWQILGVPGRSLILIHVGNTIRDTRGCILPGMGFGELDGLEAVLDSGRAMDVLRRTFQTPGTFDLLIREVYV